MSNWDVSEEWEAARRTGFTASARAEVWLDGHKRGDLQLTGGSVTVDESAAVRRTLTLPVADIDLDPREATDILAPFGTELHIYAGMTFSNTFEEVPVGVFALETTGRDSWTSGLTLTGYDRSGTVAASRFLTPWNTLADTLVIEEIAALILDVLPDVEVFDLTGSDAVTRAATWDRDRWDAVTNLAAGIGAEVAFDQAGRAFIRPVPTIADLLEFGDTPRTVHAFMDDSDLIDYKTVMTQSGVYNAVVASSDQNVPVTAIAYQNTGPLRWRAGFQRPRFYSTPVVTSYDGIAAAAVSILAKSVALSRKIAPEIAPDYSLDVGSLVDITLPNEETVTRIISSIDLTLGPGSMSLDTRQDPEFTITDDSGSLE